MAIRMYDSTKTMALCHDLMKNLTESQKKEFTDKILELFDKKTVSDDGEYSTFLITAEDITNIYQEMYG